MSTNLCRSSSRKARCRAAMAASGLILACVPWPALAAGAESVYVRDHRAAKVFVTPVARFRDVLVVRETYQDAGGKAFTNALYELDCQTRMLRYIGGAPSEATQTFKEADFYGGAYVAADNALCKNYKDPAEWGD